MYIHIYFLEYLCLFHEPLSVFMWVSTKTSCLYDVFFIELKGIDVEQEITQQLLEKWKENRERIK